MQYNLLEVETHLVRQHDLHVFRQKRVFLRKVARECVIKNCTDIVLISFLMMKIGRLQNIRGGISTKQVRFTYLQLIFNVDLL